MTGQLRKIDVYLVVRPGRYHSSLHARLSTRPPQLAADEVAIRVSVSVPDALFRRPAIEATVTIPPDKVTPTKLDAAVMDNGRQVLEQQTGLAVAVRLIEPETP